MKSDTFTIGTEARKTQADTILAHLQGADGKTITPMEAMLVYHVSRLSDVIFKLRNRGWIIHMEEKKDGVGAKYASYSLIGHVNDYIDEATAA